MKIVDVIKKLENKWYFWVLLVGGFIGSFGSILGLSAVNSGGISGFFQIVIATFALFPLGILGILEIFGIRFEGILSWFIPIWYVIYYGILIIAGRIAVKDKSFNIRILIAVILFLLLTASGCVYQIATFSI